MHHSTHKKGIGNNALRGTHRRQEERAHTTHSSTLVSLGAAACGMLFYGGVAINATTPVTTPPSIACTLILSRRTPAPSWEPSDWYSSQAAGAKLKLIIPNSSNSRVRVSIFLTLLVAREVGLKQEIEKKQQGCPGHEPIAEQRACLRACVCARKKKRPLYIPYLYYATTAVQQRNNKLDKYNQCSLQRMDTDVVTLGEHTAVVVVVHVLREPPVWVNRHLPAVTNNGSVDCPEIAPTVFGEITAVKKIIKKTLRKQQKQGTERSTYLYIRRLVSSQKHGISYLKNYLVHKFQKCCYTT